MKDIFKGLEDIGFTNLEGIELFAEEEKSKEESASVEEAIDINKFIILRKYNCPVCSSEFHNWDIIARKVRVERTDTDLRSYYTPLDPLYYSVIICPCCGYGALKNYFPGILRKQAELVKEKITPFYKHKEYPQVYTVDIAVERMKYALLNAVVRKSKFSEQAIICLRLSWLNREKNDIEQEMLFREQAIKGLVMALSKEDFPIAGMDEATVNYLLGELNRRSGNLSEALKLIGQVIVSRNASSRIKERAQDVKELILQERDNKK